MQFLVHGAKPTEDIKGNDPALDIVTVIAAATGDSGDSGSGDMRSHTLVRKKSLLQLNSRALVVIKLTFK